MTERTYTADEVDAMIARAVIKAKQEQLYELLGNPEQLEFVELIRADEREKCSKTRAGKPRRMPTEGKGALWSVAASCFDKGWREGAASVRKAIRARGNT
jgi:hypothetical protein